MLHFNKIQFTEDLHNIMIQHFHFYMLMIYLHQIKYFNSINVIFFTLNQSNK